VKETKHTNIFAAKIGKRLNVRKIDSKYVQWIEMAHDSLQCLAFVTVVVNLWFHMSKTLLCQI